MIAPPYRAILIRIEDLLIFILGKMDNIRANPYPPNFSKIAAKTIEPAIGASTCALGSHKCTVNIGSFTKNPAITIIQKKEFIDIELGNKSSVPSDIRL